MNGQQTGPSPDNISSTRLAIKVAILETKLNGIPGKVEDLQMAVTQMQTSIKTSVRWACVTGSFIGVVIGGIIVGVVVKAIGG